jgi:FKBP-type peptidyl-prolyl cis-trans isomerase FklB
MTLGRYALGTLLVLSAVPLSAQETKLATETDRISYSVGFQVGTDFRRQKVELNKDAVLRGLQDGFSDGKPAMTQEEMSKTLVELKRRIDLLVRQELQMRAQEALEAGQVFLAQNSKKEGVVSLPSGLQYQVLNEGQGNPPAAEDTVTVHYRGTLLDGTEFDSSYSRNEPATFPLTGVIKGWTEGLQLMKPGAKYRLFLPPALAYGERGAGPKIGPNAALIFEVELLSVTAGKK